MKSSRNRFPPEECAFYLLINPPGKIFYNDPTNDNKKILLKQIPLFGNSQPPKDIKADIKILP